MPAQIQAVTTALPTGVLRRLVLVRCPLLSIYQFQLQLVLPSAAGECWIGFAPGISLVFARSIQELTDSSNL